MSSKTATFRQSPESVFERHRNALSQHMEDPNFLRGIIAILIKRITQGELTISQEDFNSIAYSVLAEGFNESGELVLKVQEPSK